MKYVLDDGVVVSFEIEPLSGFEPAGADRVVGRVREAIGPAVAAAGVVLEKAKSFSPDEVEVTFGIKVSGKMDWLVAKAATDANFQVKLVWRPTESAASAAPTTGEDAAAQDAGHAPQVAGARAAAG